MLCADSLCIRVGSYLGVKNTVAIFMDSFLSYPITALKRCFIQSACIHALVGCDTLLFLVWTPPKKTITYILVENNTIFMFDSTAFQKNCLINVSQSYIHELVSISISKPMHAQRIMWRESITVKMLHTY